MTEKLLLLLAIAMTAAPATPVAAAAGNLRQDWHRLDVLAGTCNSPAGPNEKTEKACADRDKLSVDLGKRGYCVYGHGVIGIKGKGKHCYEIGYRPQ